MSKKSPIAIHKALIGIGGEPKSVKRLRSRDLLIETNSSVQIKSFLLAKYFLDCSETIAPHKSLNFCRGVISEPKLLCTSETEILEGFSDQGVTQIRTTTQIQLIKFREAPKYQIWRTKTRYARYEKTLNNKITYVWTIASNS
ncbi:uncharacterized protein TNCV_3969211 [Trichonephila clavipes]|nr:uncharacterized protein TNCV_3969211 [Trichonephila clavipes]